MKTLIRLGRTQYHSENNHIISDITRKMEHRAEIAMEFGLMPHKESIIPLPRECTHKLNKQFCDILKNDIVENLDNEIKSNSDFIHAKEKVLS